MVVFAALGQSVWQLLTVLLIFAFVLAVTYFTSKYIGSFQREKSIGENISVVENHRISSNKYIQIVKIGKKYFALAICKDTVTTISEIPEDDLSFVDGSKEKMSFKDFLKKAKEEENE